jgi:hypothetical protein
MAKVKHIGIWIVSFIQLTRRYLSDRMYLSGKVGMGKPLKQA